VWGRLASRIGLVLLVAGLLLGGFVAFQLWGTGLYEHHRQAQLAAELPASEQPRAQSLAAGASPSATGLEPAAAPAPTTSAPALGSALGWVIVPAMGLDAVMTEGVTAAQLRGGPGHYPGTALPGQAGNVALAGHRTTYAAPFSQLQVLVPGDPVYLLTPQGLFRYDVVSRTPVAPTDVSVLNSTGTDQLTLTTCNPRYSAAQRLVVVADFEPGPGRTVATDARPPGAERPPAPADLSGTGDGSPWWVVAAGAVLALMVALVVLAGRRVRRDRRWLVLLVALPFLALALVALYAALSLVLPAAY